MVIHTLTFLSISKRSPSKTYLACLTPNLCFIIQSSCTHVSLKMQDANSLPVLPTLSRLPTCGCTLHAILPLFMFLFALCCAFWLLVCETWNTTSCFRFPLQSSLRFWLVEQSLLLRPYAWGYLLISAFIVTLRVHLNLTSQLYIYW